jgi:putative DNA primase/helicase
VTTDTLTPTEVHLQALAALRADLCPIPQGQDGSKAPFGVKQKWSRWQSERPSETTLNSWYSNGRTGLGIVCGAVSGNLECLEFDDRPTYEAFLELAHDRGLTDVVARIREGYESQTPGDGIHWPYRCSKISGNTKLACRPKLPEEMSHPADNIAVLIETRGQGGFIVEAPSFGKVHPTGKPYRLLRGSFETITTITPEERAALFELARSFDQMPKPEADRSSPSTGEPGGRPGDDFNAHGDWGHILVPKGWQLVYQRGDVGYWRRPGKNKGISATTNYQGSNLLYVFSTSTPFDSERGYSKFSAYALLEHGGDYAAAAQALSGMGYVENGGVSDFGGSYIYREPGTLTKASGPGSSSAVWAICSRKNQSR